jgi:hypothetical protein
MLVGVVLGARRVPRVACSVPRTSNMSAKSAPTAISTTPTGSGQF